MNILIGCTALTALFLLVNAESKGQDKTAGTEQITVDASARSSKEKRDSLKFNKRHKHKRTPADAYYNPYLPPAAPSKPLPYNSYREHPVALPEGGLSNTIREAIVDKRLYKKKN